MSGLDFSKLLETVPKSSGVYLIKDSYLEVIYIGKAKNLRKRLSDYFYQRDERQSVKYILEQFNSVETIVTQTERQALLLEADLIKKYKPKYNIRLKDDKAYLLVKIDKTSEWPKIELVRRKFEDSATYLGPFSFSSELRTALEVVKKTIPLRTCADSVLKNRVRPCLEYQIKRCPGPCCLEVDREEYLDNIEQAIKILKGENKAVVEILEKKMTIASTQLRFEEAALYRDRIEVLNRISEEKNALSFVQGESRDAIAFKREGKLAEICIISVRKGLISGARNFSFKDVSISDHDLISSIVQQYYLANPNPVEEILLPFEIEDANLYSDFLSEKYENNVKIFAPKRGAKYRLLEIAGKNAEENFNLKLQNKSKHDSALKGLQEVLCLEQIPRLIECVDVSHFQGSQTVASVVCFKDGEPYKSRYRHFKLEIEGKPDDFASMREVVSRHLSRAIEENTLADLIVIDGGEAQLSQAVKARNEISGSYPQMIGLAKKRGAKVPYKLLNSLEENVKVAKPERVFLEGARDSIVLLANSKELNILERIRDEAHRFAVSFHRVIRTKKILVSDLDLIPGIGPRKRRELLKKFGSIESIKKLNADELTEIKGISEKLARQILESLNSK